MRGNLCLAHRPAPRRTPAGPSPGHGSGWRVGEEARTEAPPPPAPARFFLFLRFILELTRLAFAFLRLLVAMDLGGEDGFPPASGAAVHQPSFLPASPSAIMYQHREPSAQGHLALFFGGGPGSGPGSVSVTHTHRSNRKSFYLMSP